MKLGVIFVSILAFTGCMKAVTPTDGMAVGVLDSGTEKTTANIVESGDKMVSASRDNHAGHHEDDNPRPFDASRNAMMDVDVALAASQISGKNVLLVLGGNWCHDSRGLAGKFEQPELAAVIAEHYELVFVDVGHRDRNLDVAERFGVADVFGTPTVLILSPEAVLLNTKSVHDWRTADSKPYDETLRYFQQFASGAWQEAM